MEGKAHSAALSLGGNMGDVESSFRMALKSLADAGLERLRVSSLYTTKPVGCEPGAADFLNAAATGFWKGSPFELLSLCKDLEARAGRPTIHPHWHSRPLDIDLILFGDLEVKTDTLTLPHPEASKRRFVLEPLSEIAPDIVFPGFGMTIMQMLGELPSGDATVEINPFKFP